MLEVEVQSLIQFQPGSVSQLRQRRLSPGDHVLADGVPLPGHWVKGLGLLVKTSKVHQVRASDCVSNFANRLYGCSFRRSNFFELLRAELQQSDYQLGSAPRRFLQPRTPYCRAAERDWATGLAPVGRRLTASGADPGLTSQRACSRGTPTDG